MPAPVSTDRSSSPERLVPSGQPTPPSPRPKAIEARKYGPDMQTTVSEEEDDFEHVSAPAPKSPVNAAPAPTAAGLKPPVGQDAKAAPSTSTEPNRASAQTPQAPAPQAKSSATGSQALVTTAQPAKTEATDKATSAKATNPAANVTTVVRTKPVAPKSKLEQLADAVYNAALAVFAAIAAVVAYVVRTLSSGLSWGRAKVGAGLQVAKAKLKQGAEVARRWTSNGLHRVQSFAAPAAEAPTGRYAKAKAWVKGQVHGSCAYLLGKLNGQPAASPSAKPAATPASKPAATPASKPVATPVSQPAATPANKPAATPAPKA